MATSTTYDNPASVLPPYELVIMPAVQKLGEKMIADAGEEDPQPSEPLAYYGEWFMEDLSEAGYSETRPNDRLSYRAFGNLLRVNPADLTRIKKLLRSRHKTYHDFAVCLTIMQSLRLIEDVAPALTLLAPGSAAKSKGPFYPGRSELNLLQCLGSAGNRQAKKQVTYNDAVRSQIETVLKLSGKKSSRSGTVKDSAAVNLGGAVRVPEQDLVEVASLLKEAGCADDQLKVMVARVVLYALRVTPRFAGALKLTQPGSISPA